MNYNEIILEEKFIEKLLKKYIKNLELKKK
jgi:hypothetical protein